MPMHQYGASVRLSSEVGAHLQAMHPLCRPPGAGRRPHAKPAVFIIFYNKKSYSISHYENWHTSI
jgi:hypothetical protein